MEGKSRQARYCETLRHRTADALAETWIEASPRACRTGAQYYHDDQIGSARVMTDAAGNKIMDCTFNPFGEQVVCSPDNASNHYRFSGKEYDSESQLDDFGARYFSSSMG